MHHAVFDYVKEIPRIYHEVLSIVETLVSNIILRRSFQHLLDLLHTLYAHKSCIECKSKLSESISVQTAYCFLNHGHAGLLLLATLQQVAHCSQVFEHQYVLELHWHKFFNRGAQSDDILGDLHRAVGRLHILNDIDD